MENQDLREFIVKLSLTDLLLYRSEKESSLLKIQEQKWGKVLYLIKDHSGLDFNVTKGVMPINQSEELIKRLCDMVDEIDEDKVIYFSSIARILGSAILTFAIYFNLISKEEAFEYSIIDEIWQNEISGYDEDDVKRREIIKQDYLKLVDELMNDDE